MIVVDQFVDGRGSCWQLSCWTPAPLGITAAAASAALFRAFSKGYVQRMGCTYCGSAPHGNARTCEGCGAPRLALSAAG